MNEVKSSIVHLDEVQNCKLAENTLNLLSKRQREKVRILGDLAVEQCLQLAEINQIQIQFTGEDPLRGAINTEAVPSEAFHSGKRASATHSGVAEPSTSAVEMQSERGLVASPLGKAARLSEEQEAMLLAFFSLQDTLTREATVHLTQQVGCSERQVQDYFARLRKTVRDFLHRLQKKTWDVPTGSHSLPSAPGIPSATAPRPREITAKSIHEVVIDLEGEPRFSGDAAQDLLQEQLAKSDRVREEALNALQGHVSGEYIHSTEAAEAVANLMRHNRSWSVRQACLMAIKATKNGLILQKLLHSVHLLAMLSSWIDEALLHGQISCLRAILRALRQFKLSEKEVMYYDLPKKLTGLQTHRAAHVGRLAKKLLQHWGLVAAPKKKSNHNTAALDPVAIAVPLKKRVSDTVNQLGNQLAQSRKRPAAAMVGSDLPTRNSGQQKAQPVNGKPKSARLDLTALGNIRASHRQPAPKPRPTPEQEEAMSKYRGQMKHLQAEIEVHKLWEQQNAFAKIVRAQSFRVRPANENFYAPAACPQDFDIRSGEESQERLTLDAKHRIRAGVSYGPGVPIPPSPAEPLYEPPVVMKTAQVPFLPVDPGELKQQYSILKAAGILLEHLVPPACFSRAPGTNPR